MAGMICVAREAAAAAAAGFCASPFAGTGVEVPGFLGSAGEGTPRFRTGRSGSSSGPGGAGVEAAGAEAVGAGLDPAGGADCGGSAGFAELARLNTGGPSTGPGAGFECASLLLAAAANALADCQVPSPIQVLFPCKAPETVKSPWETPVRTASYTVPLSSAMGTGAALYALAS